MIKNIIFDIGNVLTLFAWKEYFASFGYDTETLEKLAKATVLSPAWSEYDKGTLPEEDIIKLFIENDPSVKKEISETLTCIRGLLIRCDYAIPWIKELKEKGLQVFYLSNFSWPAYRDCQDTIDFVPYTDGGIFSCKVNLIKPDAAIYRLLMEQYGLTPSECVFIDDTLRNVETAKALGMEGIQFQNLEQCKKELAVLLAP